MKQLNQVLGIAVLLAAVINTAQSQTILSGNISGTWTTAGNPYIISDNATVPSGYTLTIQPGVIVWVGEGRSITVNGGILATGTPLQHITFQTPINTQMWSAFSVNNGGTNLFSYCDFARAANALTFSGSSSSLINYCTFSNSINGLALTCTSGSNQVNYCTFKNITNTAMTLQNQSLNQVVFSTFNNVSNGIAMSVTANYWELHAIIHNCSFSNCFGQAVFGEANGIYGSPWGTAALFAEIENCSFHAANGGCSFDLYGEINGMPGYGYIKIADSSFSQITNTAISLTQSGGAGSSTGSLINNVIINAKNGVVFQDPWDVKMQNSILVGCTNAAKVIGSLSRTVSYNNFYGNATNFIGYPSTYGTIILANRNGTPCDLLFNIFSNPLLVSPTSFALQANSPCIDAGEGSAPNYDNFFPPSQGTVLNDMGAYGGPDAGGWLVSPPPVNTPFTLATKKLTYVGVTINPPSSGHYRLEYASAVAGTNNWLEITNMDLTGPFNYAEPATTPPRFYRALKLY